MGMSISTTSPWLQDVPPHVAFPPVAEDWTVDVVVIGGGMAGVLTAYELAKGGAKVALLEKGTIGSGETGYTTAFLTQVVDLSLVDMSHRLGTVQAKQVWEAGDWAIQRLAAISKGTDTACDFFPCPAFIFATDPSAQPALMGEAERGREFGFDTSWHATSDKHTTPSELVPFATNGYLQIANQAKFHPRKLLTGVAAAITNLGGLVAEKTSIKQLIPGDPHQFVTAHGTIFAKQVVVCTNQPRLFPDLMPHLHPFQTYAAELHLPPQVLPEALFWDTAHPYTYFRVDRFADHDRLMIGGGDHPADQPPPNQPHARLYQYLEQLLPGVPASRLAEWGGQVVETSDGLPMIGAVNQERSLFVAAGFSGNGMTYGCISAAVNSQLILKGTHTWTHLFNPRRFSLSEKQTNSNRPKGQE